MTGFEVAALVIAAAGTASSIHSAQEAKSNAAKQAREQKRIELLNRRVAQATKRRETRQRIASAQVTGTGSTSSVTVGSVAGLNTTLGANLDYSDQTGQIQRNQFELGASQVASEANAQIGAALGSFAATALSPSAGADTTDGIQFKETVIGKAFGG